MRYLFTGLSALLLMSSQSLLAQPSLFSAGSKGATATRAARAGERTRRTEADASVLRGAELVDFNLFEDRHILVRKT